MSLAARERRASVRRPTKGDIYAIRSTFSRPAFTLASLRAVHDGLRPIERSVDLGGVSGVADYTVECDGFVSSGPERREARGRRSA
jgi:hypothetical protein